MKAEIKPRINLQGRTRLETVIPLATPFVVFVDPASVCNFKCKFCPTGDRPLIDATGRWQGRLHYDVFTKLVDDLAEFDQPLKVLRMYKEGEPLLNTRLPDMIRYAKASGHVPYIDTTTNGYLLTPKNVDALVDAGIDRINISVDGLSDEMFWDLTQTKVDFAQFVEQIKYLYANKGNCEICIKMLGDTLSEDEKKKFFDVFGNYCDRIALENLAPCWPEFDADVRMGIEITQGIYGQEIAEVDTCPYIFYSMAVNSDGTVSVCFLDWARKLVIGDVRTQSLKSIWNSDVMFEHQIAHLQGKRKENPTCAACGQLSHCMTDNIDPYVAELAERLIAHRRAKAEAVV